MTNKGEIAIRTYERGVEDETLACGTGSVAAALIMAKIRGLSSPVDVLTRSRERLSVYFRMDKDRFHDVHLEGGARIIYVGRLNPEAWA
jgi:diaminopimelate epimerase